NQHALVECHRPLAAAPGHDAIEGEGRRENRSERHQQHGNQHRDAALARAPGAGFTHRCETRRHYVGTSKPRETLPKSSVSMVTWIAMGRSRKFCSCAPGNVWGGHESRHWRVTSMY